MDYNTYVQQIATMAVVPTTDSNYQIILPQMISYAELRMQRDLDFLSTQVSTTAYSFTSGNNILTIPQSQFVTSETFEVINGSGVSSPLLPVTKEYIQNVYGSGGTSGLPLYYAEYGGDAATTGYTSQLMLVGPTPDSAYNVRLTGTVRSAPLSATNQNTYISSNLPDMMIMASMIYISAYQRNFGKINDDPAMAQTYESQYQALLRSALIEENRKKYEASAWTSYSPAPAATPSRG
jgi:hypothetical protein